MSDDKPLLSETLRERVYASSTGSKPQIKSVVSCNGDLEKATTLAA
ncbi:hypothetical protein [Nostoc sp. ChiVER01]|nr:hypothetical protein [Nostoc sp. ChiVER01]